MEEKEFNEKYPIKGELRLSYVNEKGMLFTIIPLIGLQMEPGQIKAELQIARIKLNEKVNEWNNGNLDKQRVRDAINKIEMYAMTKEAIPTHIKAINDLRQELI